MAIAALIIGIISILFSFLPVLSVVSIFLGIIALSLGLGSIISKNTKNKGMGITGFVLGIVSIVISIFITVIYGVSLLDFISDDLQQYLEDYDYDYDYDYNYNYDYDYQKFM